MVPAIVLGSHVMGLAVTRALGIMGVPIVVVVYDEREEMGYVSKYVAERIPSPHPEKSEDQFIDVLVKSAAHLGGVLVFRYPSPPEAQGFFSYVLEYAYSFVATFVVSLFLCVHPGFDIIHAANPPDSAVFIALFHKLFGKRFVFDHHDLAPEMYVVRSKYRGN